MMMRTPARSWNSRSGWIVSGWAIVVAIVASLGATGCKNPNAILIRATADAPVEKFAVYVRTDATKEIYFSGYNDVATADKPLDLSKSALKVALRLQAKGDFTLMMVGVIGALEGDKPAVGARQFFWAGRVKVGGTEEVRAHLYEVAAGQDADRDLWPSAMTWLTSNPNAASEFASKMDLLDCYDLTEDASGTGGKTVSGDKINPFAREICGDGIDEACDGADPDETCVDADNDGDPSGTDCDDADPKRHNPNSKDPYPDPPNCCGYNLGFAKGTMEGRTNYVGDPVLCPGTAPRCGDGIDNSCKGIENNASNDTKCVVDNDCDGFSPPNDCDDNDPNTYPGAPEPCGGTKDLNCSGQANDGCVPCDLDGDGYQRTDSTNGCPNADDKHPGKVDCNDYDASVFPESTTVTLPTRATGLGGSEGGSTAVQRIESARRSNCRRFYETTGATGTTARVGSFAQVPGDSDCDGTAYKDCPATDCDADGDGFPNMNTGCAITGIPTDCNDADPTIFPGAPDKCGDTVAQDCVADKACAGDTDGDGYVGADDCEEGNAARHPWAVELCNAVDDDCDGLVDEGNPDVSGKPLVSESAVTKCTDSNVGECGKTQGTCVCSAASPIATKNAGGMLTACPTDTSQAGVHDKCFGAGQPHPQTCDPAKDIDIDDDCDGRRDDPEGTNLLILGNPCGSNVGQCRPGTVIGCKKDQTSCFVGLAGEHNPWVLCSTDSVCPTAEVCNGFDDNCDGVTPVDEVDQDSDKYIACTSCGSMTLRSGLLGCGDCLDSGAQRGVTAANVFPGQPDVCDGVDNNCANGLTDDGATCPGGSSGAPGGHTACCFNAGKDAYQCRDLFAAAEIENCTSCNSACTPARADRCSPTGCVCGSMGTQCDGTTETCSPPAGNSAGAKACRKVQGQSCTTGDQCLSGNCADGRCCNEACGGQCEACNRAGQEGVCGQVTGAPVGARPACSDTDGDGCDGRCSGSRTACTFPANPGSTPPNTGNMCPGASCQDSGTQRNPVTTCNNGDCSAQTTTACNGPSCNCLGNACSQNVSTCTGSACATVNTSCGDFICNGTACRTNCTMDTHCSNPSRPYCNTGTGTCSAFKQPGRACGGNGECDSGVGPCRGTCCASACAASSCNGTTDEQTNNSCAAGTGTCTGGAPMSCGAYQCGTNSCFGNGSCGCASPPCLDATHCQDGYYCTAASGGNCSPRKTAGTLCTNDNECASGTQCAGPDLAGNKYCCPTSCPTSAGCNGDSTQRTGKTCSSGTCQDTTQNCSGYCTGGACMPDSMNGQTCSVDAQCPSNVCGTGGDRRCCASACNGACATGACAMTGGTCIAQTAGTACNTAYACNGTSTACPTSCTADAQCATDHYCATGGVCTPRKADGAACTPGCLSGGCRICATPTWTCQGGGAGSCTAP